MTENEINDACSRYNANTGVSNQRTLQLLWGKWKLQIDTEVLGVPQG